MSITHGHTYQEAAMRGQHAVESLVEQAVEDGTALPAPCILTHDLAAS